MTPIEKLDKLLAESTPGPWRFVPWHIEEGPSAVRAPEGWLICTTSGDADAALIVELRNNAEALLADLRTQGEQERAAVVAWLRAQATCGCNGKRGWCNEDGPPLAFADAIERGDHRTLLES